VQALRANGAEVNAKRNNAVAALMTASCTGRRDVRKKRSAAGPVGRGGLDRTKAYNDTKAMLIAHPDIDGVVRE